MFLFSPVAIGGAAERFFRRLLKGQGHEPCRLITDKLRRRAPDHHAGWNASCSGGHSEAASPIASLPISRISRQVLFCRFPGQQGS